MTTYYVPKFQHRRTVQGETAIHIPLGYQPFVVPGQSVTLCDGDTDQHGIVNYIRTEIRVTQPTGCVHNGAVC